MVKEGWRNAPGWFDSGKPNGHALAKSVASSADRIGVSTPPLDNVLNPAALAAILAVQTMPGKPGKLLRVIEMYLSDGRSLVDAIEAAAAAGNSTALIYAAHTLKSSSANLGAVDLAARCQQIESAAHAGYLEQVVDRIQTLREAFDQVEAALRKTCCSPIVEEMI